jgi:GNAT superfamily N-acetyltransferase
MSAAYKVSLGSIVLCQPEISELAKQHHAEVNEFKDVALDIDWRKYAMAELSGGYKLFVVRHESKIIGWVGYFIYDHVRHIGYKIAKEDWYYIDPDYRKQGISKQLFSFAECALNDLGVKRVVMSCKVKHDHSALIESLGYTHYEKNFTKLLG